MSETQGFAPHRNHGCRLREYLWRGRACISLENAFVRIVVCPGKGCDILEFTHKLTDTEVLYQAPRGLSGSNERETSPLPGGPFRDQFAGGWFVMLPNGPQPCEYRGAPFGQHGEVTHLAWDYSVIDDRPERIEVHFRTRLRRMPVVMERRMVLTPESGTLTLTETVHNESGQALEVYWGHHPCFGEPFLTTDCEIILPSGGRLSLEDSANDFSHISGFPEGRFTLRNPTRQVGFSLAWEAALFPTLGLWRQWGGAVDYPAYGRRVLALEPAVDFPSLADSVARGTALTLAAGEARSTILEASVFSL